MRPINGVASARAFDERLQIRATVMVERNGHAAPPRWRRTGGERRRVEPSATVPTFVPTLPAALAFSAPTARAVLTRKCRFCRDFRLRRRGRVAEGGGLLNRYTGHTVSGVRIPPSPPIQCRWPLPTPVAVHRNRLPERL